MVNHESTYCWTFHAEGGVSVEVEVHATNAICARRTVSGFLADHDGVDWQLESVRRAPSRLGAIPVPTLIPLSNPQEGLPR